MISHNPQHARWDLNIEGLQTRRVPRKEIVLDNWLTVDGDAPVCIAARDAITPRADHPLDEIR